MMSGTYLLLLQLATATTLHVGKLGTFGLVEGWYMYVGSAFGSGGLRGRLSHHLSAVRRPHWHIDYLRQTAPLIELWTIAYHTPREHDWAAALTALPGAVIPMARFGASDCRCAAHCVRFALENRPHVTDIAAYFARQFPEDPLLAIWSA